MRKYENFLKSLKNLHEGLKLKEPYSVVEQTGIAGLFEICYEQSWKLMKAVLEEHGRFERRTGSPRLVIKIAYQCGMIDDCDGWLALLEARNILSHTYSDENVLCVIREVRERYVALFDALQNGMESTWLSGLEKPERE